ncbi:MAG: hypothetical protein Q9215_007564 [Flavoplaca cf. flavocitrina]
MAEPYGILAVCTTSFKVAQALHGLIVRLREVPNELLALSNEVCNLKFVLDSVQKAINDDERSGASKLPNVGPMLFQARVKLDSLDNMISKWAKIDTWGDSVHIGKIDRLFWLREKTKVWELQKQLRELRQGLCVLLGAGSVSALAQLSVDIQQLYTEIVRTSDAQSKSRAESLESLEVISRRMDSMEEIHRNSQASAKLLQDLCLSLAAKPLQQTQQEPTRTKDPSLGGLDSITPSSAQQTAIQRAEKEPTLARELAFNEAPLGIPVSWRQGRNMECSSECKCCCHMQQSVQALSSLGTILGRLFLAYTGSSILRKPCNLSSCRQQNVSSIRLTYFFPQWFLNSVVSTTFSTKRLGAPTLNLKLRGPPQAAEACSRLFSNEDYLQTRRFNRLHKLIVELESGDLGAELALGTVSNVDGRDVDGWTALHWAARRGNSDAVALLLAYGADPRLITWNERRSALHLAAPSNSALCVQQILQWRQGNAMVDLELRDVYGFTPLHVATELNAVTTTAFLISSSADLNARENFGSTPLLSAIGENRVEAAGVLLRYGADYKIVNKIGDNILHIAANIATVPMVVLLTKARMRGLDLEARNFEGLTVAELVERRKAEVPEAFPRAFDRLIHSIVDEDLEAGSWTSDNSGESWHSTEDAKWYTVEAC